MNKQCYTVILALYAEITVYIFFMVLCTACRAVHICPCTVRAYMYTVRAQSVRIYDEPCAVRAYFMKSVQVRAYPCTSVHDPCNFYGVRACFTKSVHILPSPCTSVHVCETPCVCVLELGSVNMLEYIYAFVVRRG